MKRDLTKIFINEIYTKAPKKNFETNKIVKYFFCQNIVSVNINIKINFNFFKSNKEKNKNYEPSAPPYYE